MKMKQIDFSNGRILENIALSAAPMLVAQLLSLLYNIVDRIYIGKIEGIGVVALGAVGLCFPIITLITAFTNLFGSGGAPLCSIQRGKKNLEKAQSIMNTSFYMLVFLSLFITIFGFIFCDPLLYLFGASSNTIGYASSYMHIYFLGTLFSMVSLGLNPFINAQGFSRTGMTTIFIGALANIILDPIFIFVFGLGVQGAAIATVISQFLSMLFVLNFLCSNKAELRLVSIKKADLSLHSIFDIISLGASSFVMQCTNSLVQVACNSVLGTVGGDMYISCMSVVNSVRQIMDTPVYAMGDGATPVLSYNYGASNNHGVLKAIRIIAYFTISYTAIAWILIILFPQFFIHIFSSDSKLMALAVPSLHMYFFAFIFQALQVSGQTVFKALNKRRQAIFFSLLRKVVIVLPLTYILPYVNNLGPMGVFMAEPISNFIGGSLCFAVMILTVYRRLKVRIS